MVTRFILFQMVILLPFFGGAVLRSRSTLGRDFPKRLIRFNLISIEPLIVLWSIWGLDLSPELILLPFSGLGLVLSGGLLGLLLARFMTLEQRSRATFLISSSLANHGFTMGGFICYILMGEEGLGLSFIFISYFMLYLFGVIFPYAAFVSGGRKPVRVFLLEFIKNPQNMPLYAVVAAVALQLGGIARPDIFFPIDLLLVISIAIYYLTVGFNFRLSGGLAFMRENLAMVMIKFVCLPLMAWLLLVLAGFTGNPGRVILIQSMMPAATYSVVTSVLFDLDADLASNMFVINTLIFLVVVLPMLCILYPFF